MNNVVGVGVILETSRGTYLLQRRDHNTTRNPGRIAPFGGGLEGAETTTQCAQRELQEELDLRLDLDNLHSIDIFESHHIPGTYIHMFVAKDIDTKNLKLQEGTNIVEVSKEDAFTNNEVTDFTKEVLRKV